MRVEKIASISVSGLDHSNDESVVSLLHYYSCG